MKKLLISLLLLLFFASGCSSSNVSDNSIKQSDIKGYWLQIEKDWSGDVIDLTDDKNSYLEITDSRLFFYSYYWDTETYGVSDKYYKLEKDKIYYDYYELNGNNWKENMDEAFSGILYVSVKDGKLILTEYNNDKNKDDGYETNTYKKVDAKDWPIEE
jgi:major membrane immunogen (membrane-anchored lipoprotein)